MDLIGISEDPRPAESANFIDDLRGAGTAVSEVATMQDEIG